MCKTVYVSRFGDGWIAWGCDLPGVACMDPDPVAAVGRLRAVCIAIEDARQRTNPAYSRHAIYVETVVSPEPPTNLLRPGGGVIQKIGAKN